MIRESRNLFRVGLSQQTAPALSMGMAFACTAVRDNTWTSTWTWSWTHGVRISKSVVYTELYTRQRYAQYSEGCITQPHIQLFKIMPT